LAAGENTTFYSDMYIPPKTRNWLSFERMGWGDCFVGRENDAPSNSQGVKKATHEIAGHENTGLKNAGHKNKRQETLLTC